MNKTWSYKISVLILTLILVSAMFTYLISDVLLTKYTALITIFNTLNLFIVFNVSHKISVIYNYLLETGRVKK